MIYTVVIVAQDYIVTGYEVEMAGLKGKSWGKKGSMVEFRVDEWKAEELMWLMEEAQKQALWRAAKEGIRAGQSTTPVLTGLLKLSLQNNAPRKDSGGRIAIWWGSFIVRYARYVELGTYKMSPRRYLKRAMDNSYGRRNRLGHLLKEEWGKMKNRL